MRILVTFILFFGFVSIVFSQEKHVNCIIFIDGKLPGISDIYDECFTFSDSSNIDVKIDFEYVIGEMIFSEANYLLLNSLDPTIKVTLDFKYRDMKGKEYNYSGELITEWIFYRYLVIRITNLNKKKGEYYFGYSTPGISKMFIKKEYNMFE